MNEINNIISKALENLSESMAVSCISKNYFVTRVQEEQTIPIKLNGIYRVQESPLYVIIDLTRPQTLDPKDFMNHSQKLYNLFFTIDKWHKC